MPRETHAKWIFRKLILVLAVVFGTIAASAQDIRQVDYFAIKRGAQIANFCGSNFPDSMTHVRQCILDASEKITDNSVRLGFTFYNFVIDALFEESIRNNPKYPMRFRQSQVGLVQAEFTVLRTFERKLFLSAHDLCVITGLKCDLAVRLEQYWAQHAQ